MDLASRLRERRERRGLKNSQVALYMGLSTAHVSYIESGKREPSLDLLVRLAEYYRCSVDYLLGITDDPRPAGKQSVSEAAVDAINLIDSLPPEKRPSAVELLRAIIVFAEVVVPIPEPVDARVGGGVTTREEASTMSAPIWEMGADKPSYRQLGLTVMEDPTQADLDRQLARLKRMVPADVYDYIIYLTNAGRPLSDADIEFLLKASDHKSLLEDFKSFQNRGSVGNG